MKKSAGAGPLRILGLDPGSRATGYGIIEKTGERLRFVTCGVIRTSPRLSFPARLQEIHLGLCEVIAAQQPAEAAIEEVFMSVNAKSALKLGHARGVIMLAALQHGLLVNEYSARSVKQAVTGYGQAGKPQVQHMVRALLQLGAAPSEDASDALAVALCHAHCRQRLRRSS